MNTRTILGYGDGSSVLWKEVQGVFGCAMSSQELAWPSKPSCHIPGERAAPLLTAMQDSSLSGCSGVSFFN